MSQDQSDHEATRMSLSDPEENKEPPESTKENPEENEEGEDGEGRRIDPSTSKKKIIRREIPKLNPARLKGPKGVATIEEYFEGFKFHGKGHEKADLERVMKRLEHWAHRLFPKYQFDDFLEKAEALGSKKELQTYLTKYRKDMLSVDQVMEEENEEVGEGREKSPEPVDEFDMLIAEQIERTKQVSSQLGKESPGVRAELDEEEWRRAEANRKLAMERKLARMRERERVEAGGETTGVDEESEGVVPQGAEERAENVQEASAPVEDVDEKEETKKRSERNRQAAMERKLARMKQKVEETQNPEGNAELSGAPEPGGKRGEVASDEHGGTERDGGSEDVGEVGEDRGGDKMELDEEKQTGEVEKEVSRDEEGLHTPKISNVSSSGLNKTNTSKKLLTDEELDKEIGAAVDMFIKGNRSSLK
ncbi:TIMELESS-interacting protein [Diachasma alloeum]|uniref:TIMELESS-interacting protein n=1 Tax=Diachasma alloeum TaxID=454923 RepID=UPI0007382093|nr:TIMELESS-interacting protein [Diachasma alloeum]